MKIEPMLAKPAVPFDDDKWLYEIKWNGERVVATAEDKQICKLESRPSDAYPHGRDISARYPEIVGSHVSADQAILDGEVVCFDDKGMPSFNRLQHRMSLQNPAKISLGMKTYPCNYVLFDEMEHNKRIITEEPLTTRKEILASVVQKENGLIPTSYLIGNGMAYYDIIVKNGYEGIMAKKADSKYLPGKRSDLWLKVKPRHKAIVEVTGYNKGQGWRERMGALLISEQGIERGKVGSGLMDSHIDELLSKMEPIKMDGITTLVKPTIQIEVSYFEITKAGHFLNPAFRRIV